MATRRVLALAFLAVGLPMMAGCAARGGGDAAAVDTSAAASPGPALVGTYEGMAWAVPGSAYYASTPVQLTITPDGFFTWSRRRGEALGRGIVRHAGPNRVILQEHQAQTAEERIELRRTGDRLWGMTTAFMAGHPTAVELEKVNP